jgi:hypothetical protein
MSKDERGTGRVRRPNHWIYLDRWWAQRLAVTRTAGVYRIRSRELARRLSEEKLGVNASGTVFVYGAGRDQYQQRKAARAGAQNSHATGRGRFRGPSGGPGGEPT